MKTFNTAGPTIPEDHYYIPKRIHWEILDQYVNQKLYFILHAPRQSGKATTIVEYVNYVNSQGTYSALYLSAEAAHSSKTVSNALFWLLSGSSQLLTRDAARKASSRRCLL